MLGRWDLCSWSSNRWERLLPHCESRRELKKSQSFTTLVAFIKFPILWVILHLLSELWQTEVLTHDAFLKCELANILTMRLENQLLIYLSNKLNKYIQHGDCYISSNCSEKICYIFSHPYAHVACIQSNIWYT